MIAPELKTAAVNLSSGYYNAHTQHEFINCSELEKVIEKVVEIKNDSDQFNFRIFLMRQANIFLHGVKAPYRMESIIRVRNCLYARYIGPEEHLGLAYDKINIAAFEENIELVNENYTIFVDQQDSDITADVFIEKREK